MLFLTELLAHYKGSIYIEGNAEKLPIASVTADSRQVSPCTLFVAIRGNASDGTQYAVEAVEKGAVAVICDFETKLTLPDSAVLVRVDNVRLALAKIAGVLYQPQPKYIAGVTGTDGKTSTADFFRQLWQMSGPKAASIGTLGVIDARGKQSTTTLNTTPDPVMLHQTLQNFAKDGYEYASIEASSHGLAQYRLDGINFKAAAFTNLTRDHLDYHKTQEAYFAAKARLFTEVLPESGVAVLNADDPKFPVLKEICAGRNIEIISYGYEGETYKVRKVTPTAEGLAVQATIKGASQHFMLNIIGEFQVMNALAALGLYMGCGGDMAEAMKHLPHLHNVPGRLEKVATHPDGGIIFIDYAHTPAALANVLKTIRKHVKGKLILIFGCGGDRDKGKRPEMGKVADELADEVIVTDDNPRSEDPATIRSEIMAAVPRAKNIGDRAEAIAWAIKSLGKEDVLLIAGKGHENTQTIGEKVIPFHDGEVARYAVKLCEKKAV